LIEEDSIILGDANLEEFDTFMNKAFEIHHKEKKENQRVELL